MTSDTQRSELLPCPFCGSEPELYSVSDGADMEIGFAFRCDDCNIEKPGVKYQEATAAWNRRTPPKVGSGELDAAGLKAASIAYWDHGGRALSETSPDRLNAAIRAYLALATPVAYSDIDYIITGKGVTHKNFTIVYKDASPALAAPVDHPEVVGVHPDVLAAHAQFGGDLEDMDRRYRAPVGCENGGLACARLTSMAAAHSKAVKELRATLHPSDSPALEAGVAEFLKLSEPIARNLRKDQSLDWPEFERWFDAFTALQQKGLVP